MGPRGRGASFALRNENLQAKTAQMVRIQKGSDSEVQESGDREDKRRVDEECAVEVQP